MWFLFLSVPNAAQAAAASQRHCLNTKSTLVAYVGKGHIAVNTK
jgi:hypothetical protein